MALGLTTLNIKMGLYLQCCFIVTLILYASRDWVSNVGVATILSAHFLSFQRLSSSLYEHKPEWHFVCLLVFLLQN